MILLTDKRLYGIDLLSAKLKDSIKLEFIKSITTSKFDDGFIVLEIKCDDKTDKANIYKKGDLILRTTTSNFQIEFLTKMMIALKNPKNEGDFLKIVGQEMTSLNNGTKLE